MGSTTAAGRARAAHLEKLRGAIASGDYAPDPTLVAESVLAWLAPAAVFDPPVKRSGEPADATRRTPDDQTRR